MLALGAKNGVGNVLHLVVGVESDLFLDIHGAKILDVTPILSEMDKSSRVFVQLTRCKQESHTSAVLTANGLMHLNSFSGNVEEVKATSTNIVEGSSTQKPISKARVGTCTYCGNKEAVLLDIPDFKICSSCAQLELGRNAVQAEQRIELIADTHEGADG